MKYPKEYIAYLVEFHCSRDYFECHEILEDYWKENNGGRLDSIWIPFIQTAVALYHHRRQNWSGAERMLQKAINKFKTQKIEVLALGLDHEKLLGLLQQTVHDIRNRRPYQSINLPITDLDLLKTCELSCISLGGFWKKSDLSDRNLIHRHKLRDRSDVIEARKKAILEKKNRK
ncbi:DUF309 domain-containing protein [Falsibacillus albus]|uniref:DUF309 domain-containing protein n=1 Tax=Falsibacillus albus TaxID=2478915 RepID=A0A3L7JWD6_9BACI|nr:DUF309 domain-containing protein [Falsibacillus albus]RLQ95043.1 DUF309 domain-containing protein [Falsibacillus albus]